MGQRATIPATRVVTVAVTNKLARIVWAIMERGSTFRERPFGIARRKLAWQDVRLQAPLCRTNSEVGKGNDDAMAFGRRTEDRNIPKLCTDLGSVNDDWDRLQRTTIKAMR
jgi:hypothetical protein